MIALAVQQVPVVLYIAHNTSRHQHRHSLHVHEGIQLGRREWLVGIGQSVGRLWFSGPRYRYTVRSPTFADNLLRACLTSYLESTYNTRIDLKSSIGPHSYQDLWFHLSSVQCSTLVVGEILNTSTLKSQTRR